jgi:hypothetical protein
MGEERMAKASILELRAPESDLILNRWRACVNQLESGEFLARR